MAIYFIGCLRLVCLAHLGKGRPPADKAEECEPRHRLQRHTTVSCCHNLQRKPIQVEFYRKQCAYEQAAKLFQEEFITS